MNGLAGNILGFSPFHQSLQRAEMLSRHFQGMAWEISEADLHSPIRVWAPISAVSWEGILLFHLLPGFSGLISHLISVSSPDAAHMLPITCKLY